MKTSVLLVFHFSAELVVTERVVKYQRLKKHGQTVQYNLFDFEFGSDVSLKEHKTLSHQEMIIVQQAREHVVRKDSLEVAQECDENDHTKTDDDKSISDPLNSDNLSFESDETIESGEDTSF